MKDSIMSVEEFNQMSHFLCDYVSKWAKAKPDAIAIIDADDGKWVMWKDFETAINIYALKILEMGLQKGDIVVSMLPLTLEHIFFEYACFKLGIMFCPLDVRLKSDEVVRCVDLLKPKAKMFLHADDTESEDRSGAKKFYEFKQFARAVKKNCPTVKNFIQFSPVEDADRGTIGFLNFLKEAKDNYRILMKDPKKFAEKMAQIDAAAKHVKENDPILIIYTTGTTGFPKPAMLTNVGIVCQNFCMAKAFEFKEADRMLVNLPPSHVGCQTEQLMTTIFAGGISVALHIFKADKTMQAIENYKVTAFGQIPSLFVMEWRLGQKKGETPYDKYDISSLRFAIYGGQAVSRPFLDRLSKMAPQFGSGLGLTELSGFVTYTPLNGTVDDVLAGLGHDYPITPMSIRKGIQADDNAGEELPDGEIGEVCFSGPQVFKGYFGNEEATRKTISKDGWCYTGDLGFKDNKGLHLAGRSKFVIKPKGYQVYPPQIEAEVEKVPEVAMAGVVGARHEIHSEGVVLYVELKKRKQMPDEATLRKKILAQCDNLPAYMRPNLIIFIDEMPLNRVDKTDYKILNERVKQDVDAERARGGWDTK